MATIAMTLRGSGRRLGFERTAIAGFFAAFVLLAFLFPYSGDDWAWGSALGVERLDVFFADYNGRYAGNLAVLLLTRASLLAPFVVAATVTAILFLVVDVTDNRSPLGYAAVALLFLTMPVALWRQSVVWTSGFTNYALPVLGLLLLFRLARREWRGQAHPARPLGLLGTAALAFVTGLFMEHVTLYLVMAGVTFVAHRLRRFGLSGRGVAGAAGALAAAVVMFSNEAYRRAADADRSDYQQIESGADGDALLRLVAKGSDVVSNQLVVQNTSVNLAIAVLVAVLLARTPVGRALRTSLAVASVLFVALTFALRDVGAGPAILPLRFRALAGLAAVLLLVVLVLVTRSAVADTSRRETIYWASGSIIVLSAPLVAVEPVGPRCFFPMYVLFLVIVSALLAEVSSAAKAPVLTYAAASVGVVAVGVLGSLLVVYGAIQATSVERLAQIRSAVADGERVVQVGPLPFRDRVHHPDPSWSPFDYRYKLFHDLPTELEIRVG